MIEGYRLGKSMTATLKCTPGVGSTTMAPLYFLPLITAVVVVLPFLVRMSSAFGISMFRLRCSRCIKLRIQRLTPWRLTSSMGMLLIRGKNQASVSWLSRLQNWLVYRLFLNRADSKLQVHCSDRSPKVFSKWIFSTPKSALPTSSKAYIFVAVCRKRRFGR